jgi:hypothetical protein
MNARKNIRANLHVGVVLEGTDGFGMPFKIFGESVDFSRKGLGVTVDRDVVLPGSVLTVISPHRFRSEASVQWISRDSATGCIRLGLRLIEPTISIGFKFAASILLAMSLIAQFSFARQRSYYRTSAPKSCVVSLAQMKSTLEKALRHHILLTENEKAFIHIQHQTMGCEDYTKHFEESQFYSDSAKRDAVARWHWKIYHSSDDAIRAEAIHRAEAVLEQAAAVELAPVSGDLQNADVR